MTRSGECMTFCGESECAAGTFRERSLVKGVVMNVP